MHIIFHDWGKNYFCFSSKLLAIFRTLDARIILSIQRSIYSAFWALPIIMVFVHEISCLIVVFILIVSASWNLKKGQWDGPHRIRWFPCVRHPVAQGQLSLHCAIIGCFHSGELHDSDDCDQPVRVHGLWQSRCIPQVESVRQSCQDSCQSTFTDMQGSWSWLSGAEGGEQAFGRHGRPVAMAGGCSARATSCFWDIPFICCKNKLGIGISLD